MLERIIIKILSRVVKKALDASDFVSFFIPRRDENTKSFFSMFAPQPNEKRLQRTNIKVYSYFSINTVLYRQKIFNFKNIKKPDIVSEKKYMLSTRHFLK